MMGINQRLAGFAFFALTALAGVAGCSAADTSAPGDELATHEVEELGEVEESLSLPKQCCLLGFRDGGHACGQVRALKVVAKKLCGDAADDSNATSHTVKGGSCSKYEECPQYEPPPVSTPRPPGSCPSGQRCCEPGANDTCLRCVDRDLICQ